MGLDNISAILAHMERAEATLHAAHGQARGLIQELVAEKSRLATLVDRLPLGVLVVNPAGEVTMINEIGRRTIGAIAVGDRLVDRLPLLQAREAATGEPLRPGRIAALRALAGEQVDNLEVIIRRPDEDEDAIVQISAAPLYDDARRIVGACAFYTEITAERIAEVALRQSEARYRALIEQAPIGIAISRDGRILFSNPAFPRLFGHDAPEAIAGRPVADFIQPANQTAAEETRAPSSDVDDVPAHDSVGLRRDGTRFPIYFESSRIELPDGPAWVTFLTDQTEPHRIARAREELARLEGVMLVARELAHRLNNSLAVLTGNLELLQADREFPKRLRRRVQAALRGVDQAAADVRRFQQVVRIETYDTPVGPALDLDRSSEPSVPH